MEEKNIVYSGITQASSDLDCKDGELSICHNLINENGSMRPVLLPEAEFTLATGEELLYVHNGTGYKNYIIKKSDFVNDGSGYEFKTSIRAFKIEEGRRMDYAVSIATGNGILQVQASGNTLIFCTDEGMRYMLFKEGDYVCLDGQLPHLNIQFGLTGHTRLYSYSDDSHSTFTIEFDGISEENIRNDFSYDNKIKITEQVMAKVNRFVKEQVTDKGYFCFPFFVRYALRLFDGTLTHHSAPIMMLPSTKSGPVVMWKRIKGKGSYTSAELDIMLVAAKLNYRVLPDEESVRLQNYWSDIVKGVEIFVSPPIYTYDPSGQVTSFYDSDNFEGSFVGKLADFTNFRDQDSDEKAEDAPYLPIEGLETDGEGNSTYPFKGKFMSYRYRHLYLLMYSKDRTYPSDTLHLPEKDVNSMAESVLNNSLFYYVDVIKTEDMELLSEKDIEIGEGYLENLTLKKRLEDEYQSHDELIPSYSYMYNQRLNLANVNRKLFDGFNVFTLFSKDEYVYASKVDYSTRTIFIIPQPSLSSSIVHAYTYINESNREYIVDAVADYQLVTGSVPCAPIVSYPYPGVDQKRVWPAFIYYPNVNAYRMVIVDQQGYAADFNLSEHRSLNGAYCFTGFNTVIRPKLDYTLPELSASKTVQMPNKLYTSEVGNPFLFPLGGINTIGTGTILGISSTTRALSQGQFGQFPLLVFATDGIWAMEVSANGLYAAKQPISRDVCSNPASITQLDGEVVFISDKGVMGIDGSDVSMLSAELDGPSFRMDSVRSMEAILEKEGLTGDFTEWIPVKRFLQQCRIAYDYPNARLLFFCKEKPYAYLYSLYARTWSTISSDFLNSVSDYPGTYLQRKGGEVIDLSKKTDYDAEAKAGILLLSRPVKLGDDAYKTVNVVINRGTPLPKDCATVLFASTDGVTYFPVGSAVGSRITRMQGSPYRYFRIAVTGRMSLRESLSMTSVYYTPKWRNKPR